jgi:hypothetical protein
LNRELAGEKPARGEDERSRESSIMKRGGEKEGRRDKR